MDLENRVALVTGGGRGIGRTISLQLARAGVNIAVNYRSHADAAGEVVSEVEALGPRALAVEADVADSEEVSRMVETSRDELGDIDILVNNAGYIEGGTLADITEEQWDRMMDVHLKGPFLCTKAVAPHMVENGEGRIINIGSVAGYGMAILHYSTAKGGLFSFTKSVARDLAPDGVTVNCVAPGPTVSDLGSDGPKPEEKKEQQRENARNTPKYPLGRIGETEDVAEAVLFFARHDYVTGEILNVSGGFQTLYSELMM